MGGGNLRGGVWGPGVPASLQWTVVTRGGGVNIAVLMQDDAVLFMFCWLGSISLYLVESSF